MTSSTLLYSAAALMALSGILMAVSASPALGAELLAAGACMAAAARHFQPTETQHKEETKEEKES